MSLQCGSHTLHTGAKPARQGLELRASNCMPDGFRVYDLPLTSTAWLVTAAVARSLFISPTLCLTALSSWSTAAAEDCSAQRRASCSRTHFRAAWGAGEERKAERA